MNRRIHDPPLPYVAPLQVRFTPGKTIRIEGTIPSGAYKFYINLQCGSHITTQQSDIALQIVVHVLDGFVALNSFQNGMWGEEQRILTLPIRRTGKFEVAFICKFGRYKIAINGRDYCEFPQRVHYDRISQLAIDGDVSIVLISYESNSSSEPEESSTYIAPSAPLQQDVQPASPSSLSDPPSYEAAMSGSHESLLQEVVDTSYHSNNTNLPTSTSNATTLLHPTNNNLGITSISYPHRHRSGARSVSPGLTVPLNSRPHTTVTMVPPPPPPRAPVRFNAPTTFRLMRNIKTPQECGFAWAIALIVVIAIIVIVVKLLKSRTFTPSGSSYKGY